MSRRSQVIQQRRALEVSKYGASAVPSFPNEQARSPGMQIGPGELVSVLMSRGATIGYKILTADDAKIVRVVATCGPIEIPLDFSVDQLRKLIETLEGAAQKVDPPAAEEVPVEVSPEAEALLQEFICQSMVKAGYRVT
jgi:hypothetical protein